MANVKAAFTKVAAPRILEAADQRWALYPYLMVLMVILTVVALFHVWSRAKVIDLNLQITEADRTIREAKQVAGRLRLEVASLKTPARIEEIAKGQLGMTLPAEQQIIVVK
jgi:cell division protein FtsL